MQVRTDPQNTLPLPSDLSAESLAVFDAQLDALIAGQSAVVHLDCTGLTKVVSRLVGVLWQAYRRCADAGSELRLESPPTGLVRTLNALDLAEVFGVGAVSGDTDSECRAAAEFEHTSGVYTDRFGATEGEIDAALDRFMQFLPRMRISATTEFELKTLFYEVTTNIRTHGQSPVDEPIQFQASASHDLITLTFWDRGVPFDPCARPADVDFIAAARSGQRCGFGIAMMRRLADNMSYARERGRTNVLTIEKKRGV
jgi:anti-sigma regulatory factor (Ser/Thr protein kinase)/anti-anti-sigma regulatory factor